MIATMSCHQNGPPPRVEVITSVQRRRRWPTAEKIRLIEETMQPGMSVSYVARRAGVAPSLLFNWRRRMLEGGLQAVQADEDVIGTSRVRELERRVRELERLLGRKTMEVEILKEALEVRAGKKTELAAAVMERSEGRFPMKATRAVSQARGRAAVGSAPPSGGRAPELRISAYHPVGEPAAKGRKQAQYQCQTGAANHAGQQTHPGTAHRAPARTHARRHRDHLALQCPLVLWSDGVHTSYFHLELLAIGREFAMTIPEQRMRC